MKFKGFSLAEIIVAMTLVTALSIIAIQTYKTTVPDSDIIKFKHTYGTVSAAIDRMLQERILYPTLLGFADTSTVTIRSTGATYGGKTKFRDAFAENFNILEEDIKIEGEAPVYSIKNSVGGKQIVTAKEHNCFSSNTGVTFCVPETPETGLNTVYLRVHVNEEYDVANAIFFEIVADGKVSFPSRLDDLFDCSEMKYNKYYQCVVIASIDKL